MRFTERKWGRVAAAETAKTDLKSLRHGEKEREWEKEGRDYKEGESCELWQAKWNCYCKSVFQKCFWKAKNKKHTQIRLVISRARNQRLKCVMSDLSDTPLSAFSAVSPGDIQMKFVLPPSFHLPSLHSRVSYTALSYREWTFYSRALSVCLSGTVWHVISLSCVGPDYLPCLGGPLFGLPLRGGLLLRQNSVCFWPLV